MMKHLYPLLCVSFLCIMSTAGYLLKNAKAYIKSQPDAHKIYKREDDQQCDQVLHDALCKNGYTQELRHLAQRCNYSHYAQSFQDACKRNSMGLLCIFLERVITSLEGVCNASSSTCSSECKDQLIKTRTQLGCCVNAFNDYIPTLYGLAVELNQ